MNYKFNLNKEIFNNFKETVNGNFNFVCFKYSVIDNKNKWSIISSCMDWISIGINYLSSSIKFDQNADVKSMKFYSIISAIDLIVESICQLNRVILPNITKPFEKFDGIFSNNIFNKKDDLYFKDIRAMFGAHPVNLKQNANEKWFASWSTESFEDNNSFELFIYSNEINKQMQIIKIPLKDLELYLNQRYEYLEVISEEIIKQYEVFKKELIQEKINIKTTPINTILELKKETKKRLDTDCYSYKLNELYMIFSATIEDNIELHEEEKKYKIDLINLIEEIKNKLQNMSFDEDLKFSYLIETYNTKDPNVNYCINHLMSYIFNDKNDHLLNYYFKTLDNFSNNKYEFTNTTKKNIIYLKLLLMFYKIHNEQ